LPARWPHAPARRYNTETVSHEVLARMKQKMVEGSSSSSHSFLLDDDSTLPFAAAEVLGAMDDKDLYAGVCACVCVCMRSAVGDNDGCVLIRARCFAFMSGVLPACCALQFPVHVEPAPCPPTTCVKG